MDVLRIVVQLAHRYLVRTPVVLRALPIDLLRARPALERAEHDHRPARPSCETVPARVALDAVDLVERRVERGCHELVHRGRVIAFNDMRRVAVAAKELLELLAADTGQDGR